VPGPSHTDLASVYTRVFAGVSRALRTVGVGVLIVLLIVLALMLG
jgi:hypothetical protein